MVGVGGGEIVDIENLSAEASVARELAPARLRSSRHLLTRGGPVETVLAGFGAASWPSGDESPRHSFCSSFIQTKRRVRSSHFFHRLQAPSKLQTSPINLREWISRLWALCGKPIRVKPWFRLNV